MDRLRWAARPARRPGPATALVASGLVALLATGCAVTRVGGPPARPHTAGSPAGSSASVPGTTGGTPAGSPGATRPAGRPSRAAALLRPGDSGPRVLALQRRLSALGYWLGRPDGRFGDATDQAVYALQKAAGLIRDGVVGPATTAALAAGVRPRPRSRTGRVVEVDLTRDLLLVVDDGRLDAVLNTSTGGGYRYGTGGATAIAATPVGVFHVFLQVDGMVVDSLGALWRPKYFDAGFAVHGDSAVPPVPVSHGCVRVSDEAIDWIWANGLMPVGSTVWVY